MAVQATCPKCQKQQNPYIDPKTNNIYCELCNHIFPPNHFLKMQLQAVKQYREVKKVPFAVKCPKCNREEKPKDTGKDIVCGNSSCNAPLTHLTAAFKLMLKDHLSKSNKDI